jgi:hypothetical protein
MIFRLSAIESSLENKKTIVMLIKSLKNNTELYFSIYMNEYVSLSSFPLINQIKPEKAQRFTEKKGYAVFNTLCSL